MAHTLISEGGSRGSWLHGAAIFITAFAVRCSAVWYLLGLGWEYRTGDGYENTFLLDYIFTRSCYMPPGQYLFAGSINQFFAEPQYGLLRIATISLSALVSLNIFRIGRDAFGRRAGVIAGYTSVVSLVFMFHSWTFYGTTLAACLFSFFLYHFLSMFKRPGRKNAVLAGIFLGLSTVTRAEMLIVVPIAAGWYCLAEGCKKENLKTAATLVLTTSLVVSCWTLRNYLVCDRFVLISSNAPVNYFIGNNPLQKGGYYFPRAPYDERRDYLMSGLRYNLNHPGWFVAFFTEKFKLYWSAATWEHPLQLLESRCENSALRLFNTDFEGSRLGTLLDDPQRAGYYEALTGAYGSLIVFFWILVLAGCLASPLNWKESYFLLGVCFASALVFSLFFSGANRCFVPILPCLYLLMGLGVQFLTELKRLRGGTIRTLLLINGAAVLVLLAAYSAKGFFVCYPEERRETIQELHAWNVMTRGDTSVRVIIMESQLSYPIRPNALTDDAFSLWVGGKEIPPLKAAGQTAADEKYFFKKVQGLLCTNAFVMNLPRSMVEQLLGNGAVDLTTIPAGELMQSLNGRITVSYRPVWQLKGWADGARNRALSLLKS